MKIFKAISLDYDSYTSAVTSYISRIFSDFGTKYNNSTVFGQIINVVKSVVQNLMLYIEDAFVEQNKFTAVRRKSIYGLAQLTGYNPSLGKAAGAQVVFSYIPANVSQNNVIINNHTKLICNQNGLVYCMILPQDAIMLSVNRDNANKMFYIVEGQFETQSFVSEGGDLYLHHLDFHGDIDDDYIEVRVNGELWENAASFYDMRPDGKQWFYKSSILGGIILGFGDNKHGRSLPIGAEVNVTYLKHNGESGNINSAEHITFNFIDSLTDINGNELNGNDLFKVNLLGTDSVSSGNFNESVDTVKQMIGYNSRAMVLASPENYKAYINRFSFCGYNRTWSDPGSLIVNSIIMRDYQSILNEGKEYFNLKESDLLLSDGQKTSILNSIINSGKQLAGVTYNIYDPIIKKYALYVYIKLRNGVTNKDYIKEQIRNNIGWFFGLIEQDDYIPKSDIIQLIKNNIDGVDGVNCYFLSEDNEKAIINGNYKETTSKYNPSTGTYDKTENTIYLYPGEDPGIGLDSHGNISLPNNDEYPVLMGGWHYISSDSKKDLTYIDDPLIITFE